LQCIREMYSTLVTQSTFSTGRAYLNTTASIRLHDYQWRGTRSTPETPKKDRNSKHHAIVHGLGSFNLEPQHWSIFLSLLCAWNNPIQVCAPEDMHFLYQMLPCTYESDKRRFNKALEMGKFQVGSVPVASFRNHFFLTSY